MRRIRRLKSSLVRLTIRQTLASRALDGKVRAFPVIDAKRHVNASFSRKVSENAKMSARWCAQSDTNRSPPANSLLPRLLENPRSA
jgi:hypothetical protein